MAKAIAKQTVTREAYETALSGYVSNDNRARGLATLRDKAMEPINKKYSPLLEELKTAMDGQFEIVQQYCEDNRVKLFVEAKSFEEFGAHVGFREGKDKVVVLDGFKEPAIALAMKKLKKWMGFVRETPAMDKVALIKAKPKGTEKLGFVIKKEESFFLEPIKTEVHEKES